LLVSDLSASLSYYSGTLGFRIGWRWSDRQSRFLEPGEAGEPGEPGTAIVGRDQAQIIMTQLIMTQRAGAHETWLHLDVGSAAQVDELFEEWRGRGAAIAEPPVDRAWGMYEMRVDDLDGHVLRVSSPPATPDG
jgi:predicted lactoylglutathione lyase